MAGVAWLGVHFAGLDLHLIVAFAVGAFIGSTGAWKEFKGTF